MLNLYNFFIKKKKKLIKYNAPVLSITFDDGINTDYSVAYPKLNSAGVTGTSYLITSTIGNSGRLTWQEINEMKNNGWIFGCHTHTHPHLTELTEQEIRNEMVNVNTVFTNNGFSTPKHHAYPYGDFNSEVKNTVSEYRKYIRKTNYTLLLNYYLTFNKSEITAYPGDSFDNDVYNYIDKIKEQKAIGVLYFHSLSGKETAFSDLIDRVLDKNISILNMDEVINAATQ